MDEEIVGSISKVEKKEKKLTKKQLALLKLVYRFRFVTSKQIAAYFKQSYLSAANSQLTDLYKRGYLGRRHDGSYRIQGRAAEYYLAVKARSILKNELAEPSKHELKRLYARPDNSTRFVDCSLSLFDIYLELSRLYSDELNFATKPQLNIEQFEYFPRPLPEAFITLDAETEKERHFFLEYFDNAVSIGIHGRKIFNYMEYKESGQWDDTDLDFPTVMIICQSPAMLKRAEKRIRYFERQEFSEISFRLIDLNILKTIENTNQNVWIDPIEQEMTII